MRVYFASHEQIALVKSAAKHRGFGFNRFIQLVLQAASEKVLAGPPEKLPDGLGAIGVENPQQYS